MATDAIRCPKCEGAMIQGFLVDHNHYANVVASWVEGAPQTSFWHGLKTPAHRTMPVGTYRCSACGFLESYLGPQFAAQSQDPV